MIQSRGEILYVLCAYLQYVQTATTAMIVTTALLSLYYLICFLITKGIAVGPVVDLGYSRYEGVALGNGVSQWLGIRFAAPPLGNLRFRAPADPDQNATLQRAVEVSC